MGNLRLKTVRIRYHQVKRIMDAAGASALLVLTAPLMAATAVTVRVRLGRPVLFRQERPGLNGEVFTLVKFRTMLNEDPSRGLVTNEQRMTEFGRRLRSTSLDELPTLWNVVRGDMSLVGPRPLRVDYLKHYTEEQARRHDVRPGVTGLAQVHGRNSVPWDERLRLDVVYVDHISPLLDLRLLLRTFVTVFKRDGINEAGQATMSKFGE